MNSPRRASLSAAARRLSRGEDSRLYSTGMSKFAAMRARALRTRGVPASFARWPTAEQDELIMEAEGVVTIARDLVTRVRDLRAGLSVALERFVIESAAFSVALQGARGDSSDP